MTNNLPKIGDNIVWCGHLFKSCMEGGRLIHKDFPWYWYSEECVHISEDEILSLTIKKDPREIHYWDGTVFYPQYAAGTLKSVEGFHHGRFRVKIIMPSGKNLWPSFWLTCRETQENYSIMRQKGDEHGLWPSGGEIDIMEGWSGNDRYFKLFIPQPPYIQPSYRTTTNVHYAENYIHKSIGTRNIPICKQPLSPKHNWIEYEVEWLPDKITFKANGKVTRVDTVGAKAIDNYWKSIGKKPTMAVIFNLWLENPNKYEVTLNDDMMLKDFRYDPIL